MKKPNFQSKHRSMFKQTKEKDIRLPCRDERALTVISTAESHSQVCGNELDFYSRGENHAITTKENHRLFSNYLQPLLLKNQPEGMN